MIRNKHQRFEIAWAAVLWKLLQIMNYLTWNTVITRIYTDLPQKNRPESYVLPSLSLTILLRVRTQLEWWNVRAGCVSTLLHKRSTYGHAGSSSYHQPPIVYSGVITSCFKGVEPEGVKLILNQQWNWVLDCKKSLEWKNYWANYRKLTLYQFTLLSFKDLCTPPSSYYQHLSVAVQWWSYVLRRLHDLITG